MSARTAMQIYGIQNKLIHKALTDYGMPYQDNKDEVLELFSNLAGRKKTAASLTEFTLGERHKILAYFKKQMIGKGSPYIGKHLWFWKKGQKDKPSTGRPAKFEPGRPMLVLIEKQPRVGKIHAILADLKLPWSYADKIAQRMSKNRKKFVEKCSTQQLDAIIAALDKEQKKQRRKQA